VPRRATTPRSFAPLRRLAFTLMAVGCGANEPSPPTKPEAPDPGFEELPGLDGGRARRVGEDFWIAGQALLTSGEGSGWLFWTGYDDPAFSRGRRHIEHFTTDGVFDRSSPLADRPLDGVALRDDGALIGYRNRCGKNQADTCFFRDEGLGRITETTWAASSRSVTLYELDEEGNVAAASELTTDVRNVVGIAPSDASLHVVTWQGGYFLERLSGRAELLDWAAIVSPVAPPEVPSDAPIEEHLRASELARQSVTPPVVVGDAVVVAATVTRGTLAALAQAERFDGELPDDPRCGEVLVARFDGGEPTYFAAATEYCEALPVFTVVGEHAVVATSVASAKAPEPYDTFQYDIGLTIVDLVSGRVTNQLIAFQEDDIPRALARCGRERVCLGGTTGAKSVDTGSTVTEGEGFVLPISVNGVLGRRWTLTGPRHTEIRLLVPSPNGALYFATVNGPITHTADADPWLGYNEGMLGEVRIFGAAN